MRDDNEVLRMPRACDRYELALHTAFDRFVQERWHDHMVAPVESFEDTAETARSNDDSKQILSS